jgi:hypothetical protein
MTPRYTYDFLSEPTGDIYCGLLEAATRRCSSPLLVTRSQGRLADSVLGLLERLSPHLTATEEVWAWPGTRLWRTTERSRGPTLRTYRYSEQVAGILTSVAAGLYAWQEPELPEDLALLRALGNVWLGSVSHESDAWLELTEAEQTELTQVVPGLVELLAPPRTTGTEVAIHDGA